MFTARQWIIKKFKKRPHIKKGEYIYFVPLDYPEKGK